MPIWKINLYMLGISFGLAFGLTIIRLLLDNVITDKGKREGRVAYKLLYLNVTLGQLVDVFSLQSSIHTLLVLPIWIVGLFIR